MKETRTIAITYQMTVEITLGEDDFVNPNDLEDDDAVEEEARRQIESTFDDFKYGNELGIVESEYLD